MVLKIFKAVWFLSLLATLAVFMYIYASLPEKVDLGGSGAAMLVSREGMFYGTLFVLAIFNTMVFIFNKLYARDSERFLTWFFGLIISLNFFFVILLGFINLVNSGERFEYGRLGFLLYGSIGLIIVWSVSWPLWSLFQKFFGARTISE